MDFNSSRRGFIKSTVLIMPMAAVISSCHLDRTSDSSQGKPVYFSAEELAFIDAAIARLIPEDELGAGAREANVAGFIDLQLAGAYGRAERWYMQGPWPKGTDEQGYQLKLTPAGLYRAAMADIATHCRDKYGKTFPQLSPGKQDDVLHGLDKGNVKLDNVPGDTFFALLWQNTQEGFLSDPMYGGNRDFSGWKLLGFPGPRYNYLDEIEQYGKPYEGAYVSIGGPGAGRSGNGEQTEGGS